MPQLPSRLRKLDKRLSEFPEASEAMLLSELDGFLAGIVICPDLITPDEWLPYIWAESREDEEGDAGADPSFKGEKDRASFISLVMAHHDAIGEDLSKGEGHYRPVYQTDPRNEDILWELWIEGFGMALALRPESWESILEDDDEDAMAAMAGLAMLTGIARGDSGLAEEEIDELRDHAPDLIPEWVETLNFWGLTKTAAASAPATAPRPNVGRNDPCPCGSGKTYKACCGLN